MRNILSLLAGGFLFILAACQPAGPAANTEAASDSSALAGTGEGTPFVLDIPRCKVSWTASKPTGTHHGIVPVKAGGFTLSGDQITGGTIVLNMAGIEVHDLEGEYRQKLEAHLRGTVAGKEGDFFNTNQFPDATFRIGQSAPLSGDPNHNQLVQGELTIKDITRPVAFKAMIDASAGSAVKITTEPFTLDRTEWGIRFKSKKFFDDLKDDFIDDEFTLRLEIGALQKKG